MSSHCWSACVPASAHGLICGSSRHPSQLLGLGLFLWWFVCHVSSLLSPTSRAAAFLGHVVMLCNDLKDT